MGAPHPLKINHGYGPGGSERLQLAISTAAIFKGGVNREWNWPLFVLGFFLVSFCFFVVVFVLFLFLFACLSLSPGTGHKLVSEIPPW